MKEETQKMTYDEAWGKIQEGKITEEEWFRFCLETLVDIYKNLETDAYEFPEKSEKE